MEYLILRNNDFSRKPFSSSTDIINPIKFQSNVSLLMQTDAEITETGSNDFEFKLPLDKNFISLGDLISYGTTEFGGLITERYIDLKNKSITYYGISFRKWEAVVGNFKLNITNTGISTEAYAPQNKRFDVSQMDICFNEVLENYDASGKTLIYPESIIDAELGDNITVTYTDYKLSITQKVTQKTLTIENGIKTVDFELT